MEEPPLLSPLLLEDVIGICTMWGSESDYGSFVWSFMTTWQKADPFNKQILFPVIEKLARKYKLDERAEQKRLQNPEIAMASLEYLQNGEPPF